MQVILRRMPDGSKQYVYEETTVKITTNDPELAKKLNEVSEPKKEEKKKTTKRK